MKTELRNHPLADLFPMLGKEEQKELTEDIKKNGLLSKITLLDGMILDGRHRYRGCLDANVEPEFRSQKGDPLAFVLSANLLRRHLTESQRAMVAAKMANMGEGKPKNDTAQICAVNPISQSAAAEKLNVSRRSVQSASKVLEEGSKKDIKAVESGEKTVNAVLKEVKEKQEEKEDHFDKTQTKIPDHLLPLWNRSGEVKELVSAIIKIKSVIRKAQDEKDILYNDMNFSRCLSHLENSHRVLQTAIPFAVCWSCSGVNSKKCTMCKGMGLVSEFSWSSFAPPEIRAIRVKLNKKK